MLDPARIRSIPAASAALGDGNAVMVDAAAITSPWRAIDLPSLPETSIGGQQFPELSQRIVISEPALTVSTVDVIDDTKCATDTDLSLSPVEHATEIGNITTREGMIPAARLLVVPALAPQTRVRLAPVERAMSADKRRGTRSVVPKRPRSTKRFVLQCAVAGVVAGFCLVQIGEILTARPIAWRGATVAGRR